MKPFQPIHYIGVMLCIITIALIWGYHLVQDNKRLEKHEQCMKSHNFDYTNTNCKICDSLIKKYK